MVSSHILCNFKKVLLLGDSLTQLSFAPDGWGTAIANHFQRKLDIVNRGFSGYNSRWIRHLLPRIISGLHDDSLEYVFILLGSNDAAAYPEGKPHPQAVSVEEYTENITAIVQYMFDFVPERNRIIIIAPPPLYEPDWEAHCSARQPPTVLDRKNSHVLKYSEAALSVANQLDLRCVYTPSYFLNRECDESMQSLFVDGLHFSGKGSSILADLLIKEINGPSTVIFPTWDQVTSTDRLEELLQS